MSRRTSKMLLAVAIVLGAAAPAQARPSLVVEAAAVGHFGGFEQMAVDFECAAADAVNPNVQITRCTFGSLAAPNVGGCFECAPPPAAATRGSGTVSLIGPPAQLCVTARSYVPATGWQTVAKCAAMGPVASVAVIAG